MFLLTAIFERMCGRIRQSVEAHCECLEFEMGTICFVFF
jgi:hypothetical protein